MEKQKVWRFNLIRLSISQYPIIFPTLAEFWY